MHNCGFFSEHVPPNQWFTRESTPERKPVVDLSKLP
jgi:hypothetical protein